MYDFEEELKLTFLNEADDAVQEAERIIIALERDEDKALAINELFRVMHNFKGSSSAVGLTALAQTTHAAESLLIKLKSNKIPLTPGAISLFLRCNDHLVASISKLRADLNADVSNPELTAEMERLEHEGSNPVGEVLPPDAPVESAAQAVMPQQVPQTHAPSKGSVETIRVPLPKIEQLLNELGELVILQTVMSQNRKMLSSPLLKNTVLQMEKILRNVQTNSMSLRMLSLKPLFQKLERIVRDTSITLSKEIEFKTTGDSNEIDKTMLEQIADPLVHVIRNSVDHGIESPEERVSKGKPRAGTIELSAFQRGGQMVIEVRDDGRGLDPEHIRSIAVKKGLISPDLVLKDEEARKLIFLPGFSTKSEVTDISGRGVGMDVVQNNVTELQGRIELHSVTGKGTTIQILLPLTLAIIEGVVVQIAEERFVVPLSQILEYHQPTEKNLTLISERGEVLLIRGESIPLLRLDRMMRIQRKKSAKAVPSLTTVIIVQANRHGKVALMVDRVIRQQQIVIKKLSRELQGHPGIMGGAVLGDGRVSMVLDILDWVERWLPKIKAEKLVPNQQREAN